MAGEVTLVTSDGNVIWTSEIKQAVFEATMSETVSVIAIVIIWPNGSAKVTEETMTLFAGDSFQITLYGQGNSYK